MKYYTLGCKLNFAETSTIGTLLSERGWLTASAGETPDLCVVNTCSVTEVADKKGRQLIRRLHRRYPQAKIIVTGCYAQLKPEEVAGLEGVTLVLGQDKKADLPSIVDTLTEQTSRVQVSDFRTLTDFHAACGRGERTRHWLKVQDGCDYWCSYCTIPMARGRSRSATISECVEQARAAARAGAKEIVLTGVNVGCFGQERGESLLSLIKHLDRVEGIERFRISSIEPNLLTEEIIDFVAASRTFMPHFHIPLQSGSDAVLSLMRRRYDTALFASRIEYVRRRLPDAFIGIDVIAGARGETEQEWLHSHAFIESLDVQQIHAFPYSERPGTRALSLEGEVSQEEKHRRVAALMDLSRTKHSAFLKRMLGQVRPVLWEEPQDDIQAGWTDNYVRVETLADPALTNSITPILLAEDLDGESILGRRP